MNRVTLEHIEEMDFRTQEAYKTLRSNVGFSGANIQTISLTSTIPNEGKSNVSIHLAISLAEAGYKVCFIDADLRKSVLVGKYKMGEVQEGLTNFLSGQSDWDDCVCETEYDNLHCVFAGPVPPNPSELLGSTLFVDKIEELKGTYDYVIIDTPPIGSVIDGAIVASVCDGTILVIGYNGVSSRQIRKTKAQLEKAGSHIIGAVLNKVDMGKGSYYDKYYGKYYGNYYGSYYGKEEKKTN